MQKNIVILENIRSVYNVGNVLRTADALCRDVAFAWYTATPESNPRVKKTSLGAEEAVNWRAFSTSEEAIATLRTEWYEIVAAEVADNAVPLGEFSKRSQNKKPLAVIFGNEVVGVEADTLWMVDQVVSIPMKWTKESLNIGQSAAIFMWELGE